MAIDFTDSPYLQYGSGPLSILGSSNTSFTITLWLYADAISNDGVICIGTTFASQQGIAQIQLQSGGIYFDLNRAAFSINGSFSTGSWKHVCALYDGSNVYLYIDNSLLASNAYSTALNFGSDKIIIGGYYNSGFMLDGKIFDCRIYNRALNANERKTIFYGRGSDKIVNSIVIRPRMIGQGGATVSSLIDLTPNKFSITIGGSPVFFSAPERIYGQGVF